jgi:hypothetical protein
MFSSSSRWLVDSAFRTEVNSLIQVPVTVYTTSFKLPELDFGRAGLTALAHHPQDAFKKIKDRAVPKFYQVCVSEINEISEIEYAIYICVVLGLSLTVIISWVVLFLLLSQVKTLCSQACHCLLIGG